MAVGVLKLVTVLTVIAALAGCGLVNDAGADDTGDTPVVADQQLASVIDDVDTFWLEQSAAIGLDYQSVDPNRILLRSELADIGPADCSFDDGTDDLTAESVEDNAYVVDCDEGDTVVLDDIK